MPDGALGERIEVQIGRLLLRSNRSFLYETVVAGIDGLDATTYPVLSGLARIGPTTATELAAEIGIDRSAVTRYLARLETPGYVQKSRHSTDGRAILVDLSPTGRQHLELTRRRLGQIFDSIVRGWPDGEGERFVAGLEQFTESLIDMRCR